MAIIIDRRDTNKNRSANNRKKFIKRCRSVLKDQLEKHIEHTEIEQVGKNVKVKVPKRSLNEPSIEKDWKTGKRDITLPGNDQHVVGGHIGKPPSQQGGKGAGSGDSGMGEDNFEFVLSRKEFLDLLFDNWLLPNFIKENSTESTKMVRRRAGFSKCGIISKLDLKKSMEQAIARKIGCKASIDKMLEEIEDEDEREKLKKKDPIFLDDVDLRYRLHVTEPKPIRSAVVFFVMDVSGSMEEKHKMWAKKAFTILYLFLTKNYDKINIVFIRYHSVASEVDEETFFYSRETGGTVTSSAFELIDKIIKERYNESHWNIYVAHASDGDNWPSDDAHLEEVITKNILPKSQFMLYIEVDPDAVRSSHRADWNEESLFDLYAGMEKPNLETIYVSDEFDLYHELAKVFLTKEN